MELRTRQVHLDFHTSPYISDVACDFDADAFAETFVEARVNSVNLFARCSHGMSYYPTRQGVMHPALKGGDLLGEQIEALHRRGIRCPIYTTVAWEEHVAQHHPEWSQITRDGFRATQAGDFSAQPGPWRFNNWLHPDYQDYLEAHVREVLEQYGKHVDGFWIDMVTMCAGGDWSPESMRFRQRHGLLGTDPATQVRFETLAAEQFMGRFSTLIREARPNASIFYNHPNIPYLDRRQGMGAKHRYQTQWDVESLPSGFWGYEHFPKQARLVRGWDKPWLGMTGRFQKMWGDFGGIKPQAALEYECFRNQALGGASCVGDQLPPRGVLERDAYRLIGAVYRQVESAERFYQNTSPVPRIGIVLPRSVADGEDRERSLEGAVRLCDRLHYDSAVIDASQPLSGFELILLPDSLPAEADFCDALAAYRGSGGAILASGDAGFDAGGESRLGMPLRRTGSASITPSYWRSRDAQLFPAESDRVVYAAGSKVTAGDGLEVVAERVYPYFQRDDVRFCSHFQAPAVAKPSGEPAVVVGERFAYLADPVFREFRATGNTAVAMMIQNLMRRLIGPPLTGPDLAPTVQVYPLRRGDDLHLTFLHYLPVRSALEIDVIEAPLTLAGQRLVLDRAVQRLDVFGGESIAPDANGTFVLPDVRGRLMLTARGYFSGSSKRSLSA